MVNVIIPDGIKPRPNSREVSAAHILSKHFRATIEFLIPVQSYKQKTADIVMNGLEWEIKSPIGSSQTTISAQVKSAIKQSNNIVIDARYTKISDDLVVVQLIKYVKYHKRINKLLIINKACKVLSVYEKK